MAFGPGKRCLPGGVGVVFHLQLGRKPREDIRQRTAAGFGNVKARGQLQPDPRLPAGSARKCRRRRIS